MSGSASSVVTFPFPGSVRVCHPVPFLAKDPACSGSVPFFFVVDKLPKFRVQPCFVGVQFVIGVCSVGVSLCSAHAFFLRCVYCLSACTYIPQKAGYSKENQPQVGKNIHQTFKNKYRPNCGYITIHNNQADKKERITPHLHLHALHRGRIASH